MEHNSLEAKQQMLAECRAYYRNNRQYLMKIDEFEHNYKACDAIQWYTKDSFLYRVVNKALRTEDMLAYYTFRYFIVDLCEALDEAVVNTPTTFRVCRGAKLPRYEVQQLQIGSQVAVNGFFSSSRSCHIAKIFAGIDQTTVISPSSDQSDEYQSVLFEIDVDRISCSNIIAVDVNNQSVMPDEYEFLFSLGATFVIKTISYIDDEHMYYIQMVSSAEFAKLIQEYDTYMRQRLTEVDATLLFGNVLVDYESNYKQALVYFHRLLRTLPREDENHSKIYYHLGRIYRFMGKYQYALQSFRCAQLLQRRYWYQCKFDYGRTLAGLGTVYSKLGDSTRAARYLEQARTIHSSILPVYHVEMAQDANQLSRVYMNLGQSERALLMLTHSLNACKKKMPKYHWSQAQALHMVGLVQRSLENRVQALDSFKKALNIRESLHTGDHPTIACTCYELGVLYEELDDNEQALEYAKRALNIQENRLSSEHVEYKQSKQLVERLLNKISI